MGIDSSIDVLFYYTSLDVMNIPYYIVNAFTTAAFTGNPAAVCPLDVWLPDHILQQIAAQHNLSETAFFVKDTTHFQIRWFTPTTEVPLCGHATLAAAHVLYHELNFPSDLPILFDSLSGLLTVYKTTDVYTLNFPSDHIYDAEYPVALQQALGHSPLSWGQGKSFFLIELNHEEDVMTLQPNMNLLKQVAATGVIVTAKGTSYDFVSRVFAPQSGIDEDPVTGAAHCLLIPYWAQKLEKEVLLAKQVSKRGGVLYCTNQGDRVLIGGKAETFAKGTMEFSY